MLCLQQLKSSNQQHQQVLDRLDKQYVKKSITPQLISVIDPIMGSKGWTQEFEVRSWTHL